MIHFNRETWTTVFYWEGGIISYITKPALYYAVYLGIIVGFQNAFGNVNLTIDRSSLGMIMNFLVFLLVFRVNATHRNHQRAAMEVNHFFSTLESLIELCCVSIAGPKTTDPLEVQLAHAEAALVTKLNVIRMSLAFAVSFVFHSTMITAVTECQGEMSEVSLQDLIFLRHRLQGLLYTKEMHMVDKAICIVQEEQSPPDPEQNHCWTWWQGHSDEGPGHIYRGEVRRHQPSEHDRSHWLLGASLEGSEDTEQIDPNASISLLHLPKVIMPMLMLALKEAVGKPWGFNDRAWSMFSRYLMAAKFSISVIHSMSATPTPLPYVQLSHLLVLIFAIFYPLTIDVDSGLCDTLVMPLVIFFTIQGFDQLAKMLESATGHDVTDLNFMELIHNLEIQAKYAFDSSEIYQAALQESLEMPIRSFNFRAAKESMIPRVQLKGLPRPFSSYFQWIPMPTVILESLFQAHGHADALQQVSRCKGKAKLRKLLRMAMHRQHGGSIYNSLEEGDDDEDVGEAVKLIRQDPNLFSHYLVFSGVYNHRGSLHDSEAPHERQAHATWKHHVGGILAGHSAGRLFGRGPDESDRSALTTFRDIVSVRVAERVVDMEDGRGSSNRTVDHAREARLPEPSPTGDAMAHVPSGMTVSHAASVASVMSYTATGPSVAPAASTRSMQPDRRPAKEEHPRSADKAEGSRSLPRQNSGSRTAESAQGATPHSAEHPGYRSGSKERPMSRETVPGSARPEAVPPVLAPPPSQQERKPQSLEKSAQPRLPPLTSESAFWTSPFPAASSSSPATPAELPVQFAIPSPVQAASPLLPMQHGSSRFAMPAMGQMPSLAPAHQLLDVPGADAQARTLAAQPFELPQVFLQPPAPAASSGAPPAIVALLTPGVPSGSAVASSASPAARGPSKASPTDGRRLSPRPSSPRTAAPAAPAEASSSSGPSGSSAMPPPSSPRSARRGGRGHSPPVARTRSRSFPGCEGSPRLDSPLQVGGGADPSSSSGSTADPRPRWGRRAGLSTPHA